MVFGVIFMCILYTQSFDLWVYGTYNIVRGGSEADEAKRSGEKTGKHWILF